MSDPVQEERDVATPRETFLADIIIGATEGGTGYWAYARAYHHSGKPRLTHVELSPMEQHEDPSMDAQWRLVNIDTVELGILRILDPLHDFSIRSDLKVAIRLAYMTLDAGELDAEGYDCIVQAGLFGELVYG